MAHLCHCFVVLNGAVQVSILYAKLCKFFRLKTFPPLLPFKTGATTMSLIFAHDRYFQYEVVADRKLALIACSSEIR